MKESSARYPMLGQDIWNYLNGKYRANAHISCILRFNGRINEQILKQAVRISIDVEPVLGCRIIEHDDMLFWERREDLDKVDLYSFIETGSVESKVQQFIAEGCDILRNCQLRVKVFRAEEDTICIKINHACSDAGGLKQYLKLLLSIYDTLLKNEQYIIKSGLLKIRSQEQLWRIPAVANTLRSLTKQKEPPQQTVSFPCNSGDNKEQTLVLGRLNPEKFHVLKNFARKNNATLNDILLTAYKRAISKIAKIQENTITVYLTVDLRKYLPDSKAEAVCNLSAMEPIGINHNQEESFTETLSKVLHETTKMKSDNPGLESAHRVESLAKISFKEADFEFQERQNLIAKSGLSNPWFSNVGFISKEKIAFGTVEAIDCYMVGPAPFSPTIILSASTYKHTLTLAANFFQSTIKKGIMEQLIDHMLNDLCGCAE